LNKFFSDFWKRSRKTTKLHYACRKGDYERFKSSFDREDIDKLDKEGNTALHYAILSDNQSIVTQLLNNGANPNIKNEEGLTPLVISSYSFDKSGIKKRPLKNWRKSTILLLAHGADPNIPDSSGLTLACPRFMYQP